MSNSLWPQALKHPRLLSPWYSPVKNTEVGPSPGIYVYVYVYVHTHTHTRIWKESERVSHSVASDALWPQGLKPTGLLCPWHSPGKNTRMGSHSLLQGIFPTQGLKSGLLHCRQITYQLSHQGSPTYVCMYMYIYINVWIYLYMCMYIYFFKFFSIIGYYKILYLLVLHSKSLLLCNCFLNNIKLYKIHYFLKQQVYNLLNLLVLLFFPKLDQIYADIYILGVCIDKDGESVPTILI